MFAPAADASAVSECIGKAQIRRVCFRATHKAEFQADELAPSGGTSIAASTGHAQGGIQALPPELSLPEDGVLRFKPLRELETLRYGETSESNIIVKSESAQMLRGIRGDTVELSLAIEPASAKEYGVSVFCDANGNGFPITIKSESKTLAIGKMEAPFEVKKGESLNLRIFLDKGMIEVFANDRQPVVYMQKHKKEDVGVSLFSRGGDTVVKEVKCWKMKSIYAGQ